MLNRASIRSLAAFALITAAAASLGGAFTETSVKTWYPFLLKPSWTPPPSWFGPVWSFLYAAMTAAAWRVWQKGGWEGNRSAMAAYGIQLGLNVVWSWLFFGMRRPDLAFMDVALLWAAIAVTGRLFWKKDALAGWLFVPYLAWVSLAAALNFAIWRLNG